MRLDLHRHLEGSHSAAALAEAAALFGVRDPLFFDAHTGAFRDAASLVPALTLQAPSDDARLFYACIQKARAAYVSDDAVAFLAERAFVEAAQDTEGFEMRVSLFSMTRTLLEHERVAWRDLEPLRFAERARRLLLVVLRARDAAMRATGKPMRVRLGLSRTFESEPHYRAMSAVIREHARALCGLDVLGIVVGPEREPLPDGLLRILRELRDVLPDLTVHAGEFEDHRAVERTLDLQPQGIGHGLHAVGSAATMERLARSGVTLELCPTSNHLLIPTALASLTAQHGMHPLRTLQRAHVHCVLGSDDPTPMGTCFADEWVHAERLGVDMDQLHRDIDRRWAQIPAPT